MDPEQREDLLARRAFLQRALQAGAAIAAAGVAGWWFYEPHGPQPHAPTDAATHILDYAIKDHPPRMSIVRGADRVATLQAALNAIGGIEAYIRPGDRVLLKVNAAFATPPMLSATTHPELLAELIRLCRRAGAAGITVTDNPINDPASCFALTGIAAAARSAGAKLVLPGSALFQPMTVPGAALIKDWPVLLQPLEGITKVIGLAPVKDHHRSGASLTMKNWYGLLGGRRNIFHQDINTIIQELAMMVRPTLVVLDGTASMMTNGPTGGSLSDLKATNTMIVSTDQVAADACGVELLGKTTEELAFIAKAEAAGLGRADYRALDPAIMSL